MQVHTISCTRNFHNRHDRQK